ncbi:MAG TPA: MoaD/ThiS family protein [Myxococcota bacterium]|nr:MoaD/ThiS family protein [Myxococcota bacterium]
MSGAAPTSAPAAPSVVTVRVLLFASYAEHLGAESLELTLSSPATVADVVTRLRALPGGHLLPPKPLCARNLAHAGQADPVSSGDEIAVLPPLAGG